MFLIGRQVGFALFVAGAPAYAQPAAEFPEPPVEQAEPQRAEPAAVSPDDTGAQGPSPSVPGSVEDAPGEPSVAADPLPSRSVVPPRPETQSVAETAEPRQGALLMPLWSIGAGVGVGLLPSSETIVPSAAVSFECRLGPSVVLFLDGAFSYVTATARRSEYSTLIETSEGYRVQGSLGIRWVANPGGAVEVGMSHGLYAGLEGGSAYGVDYRRLDDSDLFSGTFERALTRRGGEVGLRSALVVERELVSRLWFRISAGSLGFSYRESRDVEDWEDGEQTVSGERVFQIGLDPSAAIQLRLAF